MLRVLMTNYAVFFNTMHVWFCGALVVNKLFQLHVAVFFLLKRCVRLEDTRDVVRGRLHWDRHA